MQENNFKEIAYKQLYINNIKTFVSLLLHRYNVEKNRIIKLIR